MTTGLAYSPTLLLHDTGHAIPEVPERLTAILADLEFRGLLARMPMFVPREPSHADLIRVHSQAHLDALAHAVAYGAPDAGTEDTPISEHSWSAALLAAGAGLVLADAMMGGEIDNGMALVRPPGHHATRTKAMGFCLLNNVAITARYLQQTHRLEKIAIVDFDVHHGNGTQDIFAADPSVLFVSLHQHPHSIWPGSGYETERGVDPAVGLTLNIPMEPGAGRREYEEAMVGKVLPALEKFGPEAVLVSAGFDAHKDDPLGALKLTEADYYWMTALLVEFAERRCSGRVLSFLEGGYNIPALVGSVGAHLKALRGEGFSI